MISAYNRLCWYIVTRLLPLTAEQIWSQGFVKGVETVEQIPAVTKFTDNHPWHQPNGHWSGHA